MQFSRVIRVPWALVAVLLISRVLVAQQGGIQQSDIFVSGDGGYHTYRIPSLIVTRQETLLAFCEGRKNSRSDSGDIDLLVKRSTDGGQTWSPAAIVWDDGENTCGNPCPVIDERTGTIHLLMTWNLGSDHGGPLHDGTAEDSRDVYYCQSDDDGLSWSSAVEITSQVKKPSWWWYATGPGVGIQLQHGPHRGRLVIPCDHTAPDYNYASHVIFSDDAGKTWARSEPIYPTCNESQVVQLNDARLMINMRSQSTKSNQQTERPRNGYRSIAFSQDGGQSWSDPQFDPHLGDPVCQASIIRYDQNRLLFSSPSPPVSPKRGERIRMTVRVSEDEGKTWPDSLLVHEGVAAYSCLARLPNTDVGLLYERTNSAAKRVLSFALIPIALVNP